MRLKITHLFVFIVFSLSFSPLWSQTSRPVASYSQLTAAITASVDGDIINITSNIVITAEIPSSKSITYNGNNYTISVPNPGLDEAGKFNTITSAFRVFNLSGSGKITIINNWNIKGGYNSAASGGAITVAAGHTARLNNTTISNSRSASGGGIQNAGGIIYMKNCQVLRNAGNYGGGFLNQSGGKMFIENTTFSENRSTASNGGGGACENNGSTTYLYVNNSTFSNNSSTEIGGAINNVSATIYVLNSSLTGNVAYGSYKGGAIGNNGGSVYAINSLFAYNYRRATGTVTSPTTYVLDDVEAYSLPGNVHLYYCIYHAALTSSGVDQVIGNVNYTGTATGSNNTIFSGGSLSRITDGTGVEIGDPSTGLVFKPFLYNSNGITPTLKTGSFTLLSTNLGTKVGYTNNSGSPIIGYYNRTTNAWVNVLGTTASSYEVTMDQVGTARNNPSAIGAVQGVVDNLSIVKINYSVDGSVSGGTVYGDVYPSGTSIVLTAIPNASRRFLRWNYIVGGTGTASTSNPYTFTVGSSITLVPVFDTVPAGTYSITYVGNGNTGGTPPSTGNYTAATTIGVKGALAKSGYIFNGWNSNANGSGTSYTAGSSYSTGSNLILYAQWNDNLWHGSTNTAYATSANWGSSLVPSIGDDVVFASDAVSDLILDQNRSVGNIQFSSSNRKLVLGDFNLTATGVSNYNSASYIQTNGNGKFSMAIDNTFKNFPVGRSTYNPVSIRNNTGTTDVFAVQVLDELYMNGYNGTASSNSRVKRTWDISKINPNAGAGIDFIFTWHASDAVGITTPNLYHYASGWSRQTGVTTNTDTTLTYTGYTGTFSPFSIGNVNLILPVNWLSFTVQKQGKVALLSWSVTSEISNKDFVVERSGDGLSWQALGVILSIANNNYVNSYQFQDANPFIGLNYYRIRQRDIDGHSTLSKVAWLQWNDDSKMGIYPNPVTNNVFNLTLKAASKINIYDNNGKLVLTKYFDAAGQYVISLQGLTKGIYMVTTDSETQKIILQ